MARLIEDPWTLGERPGYHESGPVVEVFEQGEEVVVRAEIAGVDPQDVDVRLAEDTVTIRAERRPDEAGAQGADGYFHSERQYGTFVRTVSLPAAVETSKARARFRHGLLEVRAPKRVDEARHGRKVDIEVQ